MSNATKDMSNATKDMSNATEDTSNATDSEMASEPRSTAERISFAIAIADFCQGESLQSWQRREWECCHDPCGRHRECL